MQCIHGSKRPCSYLEGCNLLQAHFVAANLRSPDPEFLERNTLRYGRFQLYRMGMIANGLYAAAPQCDPCNACVPLRINSAKFEPSKSQMRLITERRKRFAVYVESTERDGRTNHAHYALHTRYLQARHPESGMRQASEQDFYRNANGLTHRLCIHDTENNNRLVGLATFDVLRNEACFHYLSYDPDYMSFSLGKYGWLSLIDHCMNEGIKHMYVGSWVDGSPKLDYKKNFGGLETFDGDKWVDFDPDRHRQGPLFDKFVDRKTYQVG
ncbi:MAG: hypothetical protein AB7E85_02260 [Pseudobdellovibrionaceae bacterium]